MIDEICVVGHPGKVGGAGTELDHQIDVWESMGVLVHLIPNGDVDHKDRRNCCIYHAPNDWSATAGHHVISFCNGNYLQNLQNIRRHARTISWVNCMTWAFDSEKKAAVEGTIDVHLYQTDHQMASVVGKLPKRPERAMRFTPYFRSSDFPFHAKRNPEKFGVGRISRADTDKFNARQFWIWETMTAPVPKKGTVLGWGPKIAAKVGRQPPWADVFTPGALSQQEFYRRVDALVMTTDTYENLPRVGMEAMASGTLLVVDNRGGWIEQVEQGRSGWLCSSDREMVYRASRAAFEFKERAIMVERAREIVLRRWGLQESTDSWGKVFEQMEKIR